MEQREYEASKMAYRDIKNSIDTAKREGKKNEIAAKTQNGEELTEEEKNLVTLANALYERMKDKGNYGIKLFHRELRE